jgi:hypothetical protein
MKVKAYDVDIAQRAQPLHDALQVGFFSIEVEPEPTWDSLKHRNLSSHFESEFHVRIPVSHIEGIQTLREFSEFL